MLDKSVLLSMIKPDVAGSEDNLETILGKTLKKSNKYAVYNPYIEIEAR